MPEGTVADDGKRLELSEFALDVAWSIEKKLFTRGWGSGGGVVPRSGRVGRLADDGKRLGHAESALDVRNLRLEANP